MSMSNPPSPAEFFRQPILNSPYKEPALHWELDENGQPTHRIESFRRRAEFVTPIPKPKKRKVAAAQQVLVDDTGISTQEQQYDPTSIINQVRGLVDAWRRFPRSQWR